MFRDLENFRRVHQVSALLMLDFDQILLGV